MDIRLQLVAVPGSLEELLKLSSEKLGVSAKRAFTENGVIVDDVSLIRDDERIYISSGEAFWKYDGTPPAVYVLSFCPDVNRPHRLADAKVRTYKVGT